MTYGGMMAEPTERECHDMLYMWNGEYEVHCELPDGHEGVHRNAGDAWTDELFGFDGKADKYR